MEDLEQQLDSLGPELARHIRDSISRAGLQSHDPAARMITEMWVAVAALKQERALMSREMADLGQQARRQHWYLMILLAVAAANLVAVLALVVG